VRVLATHTKKKCKVKPLWSRRGWGQRDKVGRWEDSQVEEDSRVEEDNRAEGRA